MEVIEYIQPSRQHSNIIQFRETFLGIHMTDRTISYAGLHQKLPPQEFALFATYAKALTERWTGAGPGGIGFEHEGWIITRDFLDGMRQRQGPLGVFLDIYSSSLGNRERTGYEHVLYLIRNDLLGLQEFFQRKRSLLKRALTKAGPSFAPLHLHTILAKPHRAGLALPPPKITLT